MTEGSALTNMKPRRFLFARILGGGLSRLTSNSAPAPPTSRRQRGPCVLDNGSTQLTCQRMRW